MDNNTMTKILSDKEVHPLDSEFEIEELLLSVNGLDKKIAWYKELKKQRAEKITKEINKLSVRKDRLKEIIKATLEHNDKTSLNFPGIGKVVIKKTKGTWKVNDEESLIAFLKKELETKEFEKIVNVKPSILKTELNKILNMREKSGSLPSSVDREDDKKSLSVTIDKDFSENQKMQALIQSVEEINVEDMDELEI